MGASKKQSEKIQDLENQIKRALADYANLQKRVEEERENLTKLVKADLLAKFLGVLDTLEAAEEIIKSEGLELALNQFRDLLKKEDVQEITTSGDFDPRSHEAVEVVKGKADNKIVEVVEKGYKIGDKILRPGKVKVSKKQTTTSSSQAQKEIKAGDYM